MCRAVEELIREENEEKIIELLKLGKITIEEIASIYKLPVEAVKAISEKVTVKA